MLIVDSRRNASCLYVECVKVGWTQQISVFLYQFLYVNIIFWSSFGFYLGHWIQLLICIFVVVGGDQELVHAFTNSPYDAATMYSKHTPEMSDNKRTCL